MSKVTDSSEFGSEPDEQDVIFEVQDATVSFGMDRGTARVLDGVDVDIYRDEIFAIVGESGCGKTMFASSLMDAVQPPGQLSGEVMYHPRDGESFDILSLDQEELEELRWNEIAMVFQGSSDAFNPTMKIGTHFQETIKAHDEDLEEQMEHARELLRALYLDPDRILEVYPHELSGGMRQRALIALALVLEPEVLLMDEPTAALDLLMQQSIITMLNRLQKAYDVTIVFITHDIPLVAGLADRLAVMYAFEIIEIGEAAEVLQNASHPYARALIRTVPSIDSPTDEMKIIEGESPDPVNTPTGCSYHPRCPLADTTCKEENPKLQSTHSDEHVAACFHWEDASEALPYSIETDRGNSL